jgi:hypothetical protein
VVIFVYVPDVDTTVERAITNGATVVVPLRLQPAAGSWNASRHFAALVSTARQRWIAIMRRHARTDKVDQ